MKKVAAGVLPVVVLCFLVQLFGVDFETMQLCLAAATIPFAVLFIAIYIPERPWHQWFGTSLLLIAVAVLMYSASIVLFRMYGPDYPGRALMVISSAGLTLTAMVMRTWVLRDAQARDRSGPHVDAP